MNLYDLYVTERDGESKRVVLFVAEPDKVPAVAPFTWAQICAHLSATIEPNPDTVVSVEIRPHVT